MEDLERLEKEIYGTVEGWEDDKDDGAEDSDEEVSDIVS